MPPREAEKAGSERKEENWESFKEKWSTASNMAKKVRKTKVKCP